MALRTRFLGIAALVAALVGLATVLDRTHGKPAAETAASGQPTPSAPAPTELTVQLRGRIVDANGDPVVGAHVRVMGPGYVVAEKETDLAGAFWFDRLADTRVYVEADHEPEGAVRSAEISLSAITTHLTLALAPASVRGLVFDADDGHPIGGATLSVEGVPFAAPSATSDPAGAFRFAVVPFEATAIVAVANGYRASRVAFGPVGDRAGAALPIELRAGQPAFGDVTDPDGKPLRAHVVACEGQPLEVDVATAADGTFSLPPSTAGCDAVAVHDEMGPSDPVRIVEGRHITLRLGAAGTITGLAVDDRGAGVESFSVGVESFIPARGSNVPRHLASPSKAGAFRLEHLVPGTYVLTAWTAGRPPARSSPVVVRGGAVTGGVKIVIAQGGGIVGQVFDDQRAPLAGAELRFDMVSGVAESDAVATTDPSGRYRLDAAPSGLFTVRVSKSGYRTKLVSGLSVRSGQTVTKEVTLTTADGGGGLELAGVGANLAPAGNGIALTAVLPGDPAEHAGLRAGDRIVRIDGEETAGLSLVDFIQRLRGEPGTVVGLTVQRAGATLDVAITRAAVVY